MFDNDKLLFSSKNEVSQVIQMYNDYCEFLNNNQNGKEKQQFQKIAKVMRERIKERYFNPINTFLNCCKDHPEQSGFIVMGINCILIELYFEMKEGLDNCNESGNKVKDAYIEILHLIDPTISEEIALIFYKNIRCKIIHQGQTGAQTAITFAPQIDSIIILNGEYYLCNPKTLFNKLTCLYDEYWRQLSKGENINQKKNFIKKIKYILFGREG